MQWAAGDREVNDVEKSNAGVHHPLFSISVNSWGNPCITASVRSVTTIGQRIDFKKVSRFS